MKTPILTRALTSALRVALTRSLRPFVFEGRREDHLPYEDLDNLGLYVHIPFCRSICNFCPYQKEIYDESQALRFKEALLSEIDLVCTGLSSKKEVTSLYFGGGTPALMADSLTEIIAKLRQYFIIKEGIGLELHPDDMTAEVLTAVKEAGVTMVSAGIQSFDRRCLKEIGRGSSNLPEKLKLVASYGFEVIDVDLIFAMPGQDEASLLKDFETAFACGATQVSAYPFIDFTYTANSYRPQSQRQKKKMLQALVRKAEQMELNRSSVWTFAKKGTSKYSSVTRDNFLGFGPSATTLLRRCFKVNTFSVDAYIRTIGQRKLPTALTLDFSPRQRAVYYLFWNAYGLKLQEENFQKITGRDLKAVFGPELYLGERLGYIRKAKDGYELTAKGADAYHRLEQVYTTAYIDRMWHIARQEPFPPKIILK